MASICLGASFGFDERAAAFFLVPFPLFVLVVLGDATMSDTEFEVRRYFLLAAALVAIASACRVWVCGACGLCGARGACGACGVRSEEGFSACCSVGHHSRCVPSVGVWGVWAMWGAWGVWGVSGACGVWGAGTRRY